MEKRLKEHLIRAAVDGRNEKIGAKIRDAQLAKVPYMLVVGKKEVEAQTVAVRSRAGGDQGAQPLDLFLECITGEILQRT